MPTWRTNLDVELILECRTMLDFKVSLPWFVWFFVKTMMYGMTVYMKVQQSVLKENKRKKIPYKPYILSTNQKKVYSFFWSWVYLYFSLYGVASWDGMLKGASIDQGRAAQTLEHLTWNNLCTLFSVYRKWCLLKVPVPLKTGQLFEVEAIDHSSCKCLTIAWGIQWWLALI